MEENNKTTICSWLFGSGCLYCEETVYWFLLKLEYDVSFCYKWIKRKTHCFRRVKGSRTIMIYMRKAGRCVQNIYCGIKIYDDERLGSLFQLVHKHDRAIRLWRWHLYNYDWDSLRVILKCVNFFVMRFLRVTPQRLMTLELNFVLSINGVNEHMQHDSVEHLCC